MAIEITDLRMSYGELTVFRDLDLVIPESEVTVLVGPSGCGKTTLLDIIAGSTTPDSGCVGGLEGHTIGYVFQEPRLLPWMTVIANIEFVLRDHFSGEECRRRAEEWIARVGLAPFEGYLPNQLSGGMRQRVGLARAFAYPSSLLLLDEPFQALDLRLKLDLVRVFEELWLLDKRTTLLVSHDINETLLLGHELFVLSQPPTAIEAHFTIEVPHGRRSLADDRLIEVEHRLYALLAGESR
ncbi:MAG TPA: ABC transporter ATP-binding protein [Spirochaetia bacterium]|nr:ABC transporter ATP-binding protein [Spirochaetia bacterium]